jgi:hypothetical protein
MLMVDVCMLLDILDKHCVCTPEEEQAIKQRIEKESVEVADRVWMDVMVFTPAEEGHYVVCGKWKSGQTVVNTAMFCKGRDNSKGRFLTAETFEVTHWMPLPDPPTE